LNKIILKFIYLFLDFVGNGLIMEN